jgi:anti-anti-sigma factor
LRYSIEKDGEVIVVHLTADMWGKIEDYQIKDEIAAQLDQGGKHFIFEFKGSNAINSTGIGIVVSSLTAIQRAGGRLRLCGLNPRVNATFEITGIANILSIFDSYDSAVRVPWPEGSSKGESEEK